MLGVLGNGGFGWTFVRDCWGAPGLGAKVEGFCCWGAWVRTAGQASSGTRLLQKLGRLRSW